MAEFIKIEVIEGQELAKKFQEKGKKAVTETERNVHQAGIMVGDKGKQLVRVLTGRCRASIATRLEKGSVPVSLTGPQVHYGAALESRYPYMEPALEQEMQNIKNLFGSLVTEIVKKE